jgi:membrane protease YdiL (CAAX protease family)
MSLVEWAFAALVVIGLPVRAWRDRHAPFRPPGRRFLVEKLLLTAVLAALLWRRGVQWRAIAVHTSSIPIFLNQVAISVAVVIAPDAIAAFRLARRAVPPHLLPAPDPVFRDVLAGRQSVGSFLAVAAVSATWEELCFRATPLVLVPRTAAGIAFGVMAASLAFGMQHVRSGRRAIAYTFTYGVVFSILYIATGNLMAIVIAHAAGNVLSGLHWAPRIERLRQRGTGRRVFVG